MPDPAASLPLPELPLTRRHDRRLREIYRSAGWPSQDLLEIELLAAGLLERITAASGHETLRVTDAGVRRLAEAFARNKAVRSAHEALVERLRHPPHPFWPHAAEEEPPGGESFSQLRARVGPALERMDFGAADVWGATDSWQGSYHVQSYFVGVGRKVLDSAVWRRFWNKVRPVKSKIWVVLRYEIGLSRALVRGGFDVAAIWRYQDLIEKVDPAFLIHPDRDAPVNEEPMIAMRRIHAHRIRHNVSDIAEWRDEVRQRFGAVPEAIERDLRRVMRNRVA